ncbi:hypothetical protein HPB47_023021, partial [Ixodes persulcatus]
MLANGQDMNAVASVRHGATRSQDDAMVGYFFQRPQSDPDFQNYNKQSRWALGDDSVLEARGTEAPELETEFQALALETSHQLEIPASTKKLWALEETGPKPEDSKGIFLGDQWRDPTWSTGGVSSSGFPEHAVSQPIMVQRRSGSYPGSDGASMLSPRSSETSGLGVKMVEYVLGSSPTIKDLDVRMGRMHVGPPNVGDPDKVKKGKEGKLKDVDGRNAVMQANGIMHNGIDEDKVYNSVGYRGGSRQASPSEELGPKAGDKLSKAPLESLVMSPMAPTTLEAHFDHHAMGIDPLSSFDYQPHGLLPSMESPGMLDYSQYPLGPSQGPPQGGAGGLGVPGAPTQSPFGPPSNPYLMNQDPYGPPPPPLGIVTGPAMMPQYYGMPPWGMFPTPAAAAGLLQGQGGQGGPAPQQQMQQQVQQQMQQLQQQQQQMLRGSGARPMTPQGGEPLSQAPPGGGQYQVLAPPYYDQNSQLMMSNTRAVRLMPPVLVNPGAPGTNPSSQPGSLNGGSLRLLGSQGGGGGTGSGGPQGGPQGSGLFSAAGGSSHPFGPSGGYNPGGGGPGASAFSGAGGFASGLGYGGPSSLGPIGTSPAGPVGIGLGGSTESPRRDSLERRDGPMLTGGAGRGPFATAAALESSYSSAGAQGKGSQFYGPLGTVAASPGPVGMLPQSLTPPPPSLNGSSSNLSLGSFGGRMMSAAPGAEAKYLVRNGPLGSMLGSSSALVPGRTLQRNSSLEKPPGRSRLLEDFRNNRYPNLQLRDLANHIVEFSQDQHGSRFIQQKLERATPSEKQLVFSEILGAAYNLMTDVFGNYVIQKFFEFGSPEQKQALALKVKGHVLPLALQMYGCRVIQKALESISTDQQKEVVKELDGHVLKCVKDQNGNHVVQKCIECVDPTALQFVINAFQGQ